jgi:hypothetical protein
MSGHQCGHLARLGLADIYFFTGAYIRSQIQLHLRGLRGVEGGVASAEAAAVIEPTESNVPCLDDVGRSQRLSMKARFLQIADDFRGVSAGLRTTLCR